MLNINIICVGKLKEEYLKNAIKEYSKRLGKYCSINMIEIPDERLPDKINDSTIAQTKDAEGKKILAQLKKDSYHIILDLDGKELDSVEFSKKIESITVNGYSAIDFIIGGTLGLSDEVKKEADFAISFSKLTFPHQLIRVFLLEQIFRAFKIINNETYHW
jgi:23S rRNA (pseudouridine1915-N3)-methyltransferase